MIDPIPPVRTNWNSEPAISSMRPDLARYSQGRYPSEMEWVLGLYYNRLIRNSDPHDLLPPEEIEYGASGDERVIPFHSLSYLQLDNLPTSNPILDLGLKINVAKISQTLRLLTKQNAAVTLRGSAFDFAERPETEQTAIEISENICKLIFPETTVEVEGETIPVLHRKDRPSKADVLQGHWLDLETANMTAAELREFYQTLPKILKEEALAFDGSYRPDTFCPRMQTAREIFELTTTQGCRTQFITITEGGITQLQFLEELFTLGIDPSIADNPDQIAIGAQKYSVNTISINSKKEDPTADQVEYNYRAHGSVLDKLAGQVSVDSEGRLIVVLPEIPKSNYFEDFELNWWEDRMSTDEDKSGYNSARFLEAIVRDLRKTFHYGVPHESNARLISMIQTAMAHPNLNNWKYLMGKNKIDLLASQLWARKSDREAEWTALFNDLGLNLPPFTKFIKNPCPETYYEDEVPTQPIETIRYTQERKTVYSDDIALIPIDYGLLSELSVGIQAEKDAMLQYYDWRHNM